MSSWVSADGHLIALAWSLWAELGVSGWSRHHSDFAIDPEALVVLTAWLHDADPRLRDEATDWCVRYGQFISGARLKNVLAHTDSGSTLWWKEFASTVNANSRWSWPGGNAPAVPRKFELSKKSQIDGFTRPALLFLRVRALVGLGARAEILRLFASQLHERLAVAEIAAQIGYSKRNTAEALDGLELAGLLSSFRLRNRLEYTVADPDRLLALVEPRPGWVPPWVPIISCAIRVAEFLRRAEDIPESVASVESVTLVRELGQDIAQWGVTAPQLVMVDEPAHQRLFRWSGEVLSGLAEGDPRVLAGRRGVDLDEPSRDRGPTFSSSEP